MTSKALLFFVAALFTVQTKAQAPACLHPYIFFDVGMTLIDTSTHKYNPMFLMPRASEHLKNLKFAGFQIGIISDVPISWGRDLPEFSQIQDPVTAKWLRMISFFEGRFPADKVSWLGEQLEYLLFGSFWGYGNLTTFIGRVFLPMSEGEQKSKGSLILFQRARYLAGINGCGSVFIGEDGKEIQLAKQAGMGAFWVGHDKETDASGFYPSLRQLDQLAQ